MHARIAVHRLNICTSLCYVMAVVFTSDMIIPPSLACISSIHFPHCPNLKPFIFSSFLFFSELYYYLLYSIKSPFLAHLNVSSCTWKQHNNKELYRSQTFLFMLVLTVQNVLEEYWWCLSFHRWKGLIISKDSPSLAACCTKQAVSLPFCKIHWNPLDDTHISLLTPNRTIIVLKSRQGRTREENCAKLLHFLILKELAGWGG